MEFDFFSKKRKTILALGAESDGNFSIFRNGNIFFSDSFGDLLNEKNWLEFQKSVLKYLEDNRLKPDVILTDLHPSFLTTRWGEKLTEKFKAEHIPIQHHHAHVFGAIGDLVSNTKFHIPDTVFGIAMDGTGYGLDGKIWGGEIFKIIFASSPSILRIGHLENQILIGGDLAIREPARVLISILGKILTKNEVYPFIKKHYSENEFELLWNQLQQNFNCQKTSSAGRVLDAASLLLGFCRNQRKYKHEPIDALEKNSSRPFSDLEPKIRKVDGIYELDTTYLFEHLLTYVRPYVRKNIPASLKKSLAATTQIYLAQGLWEIMEKNIPSAKFHKPDTIFGGGGLTGRKIISDYLVSKGAYASKTTPRGDAGISFGQIIMTLLMSDIKIINRINKS